MILFGGLSKGLENEYLGNKSKNSSVPDGLRSSIPCFADKRTSTKGNS